MELIGRSHRCHGIHLTQRELYVEYQTIPVISSCHFKGSTQHTIFVLFQLSFNSKYLWFVLKGDCSIADFKFISLWVSTKTNKLRIEYDYFSLSCTIVKMQEFVHSARVPIKIDLQQLFFLEPGGERRRRLNPTARTPFWAINGLPLARQCKLSYARLTRQ